MINKYLLLGVSTLAISAASANTEYQLASSFKYNENATLDDLASKPTVVRAILKNEHGQREDGAPRDIDNAAIAYNLRQDMDTVRAKVLTSDAFLYDKTYDAHEKDISQDIYQWVRAYLNTPVNRDARLDGYLSAWFSAEMRALGSSVQKNLWSKDKTLGSDWSVASNAYDKPSATFLYKNGKSSDVILPLHVSNRLMSTESFLKKGVSFNKLSKEDVVLFDMLKSIFLDKKDPYGKKSLKGNIGAYLNGASNPKSLGPLNEGLRPEEIFIRDALLTATFRDEVLKRARLSHLTKDRIPENVIAYWASSRGKVIPHYGGRYMFGVNMFGDISLIIPSNKAALPLLKESRNNPGCFIPFGHKMSDINVETGLFWLNRNKDRVDQVTNALIGVQNEDFNPLKKALREMSLNIKDGVHIPLNHNNKLALEGLNYLLVNSFVYNNDFLSACEKNRNVNRPYYDAVISFIKDYRGITFHLLDPISPLHGSLISRNRVPASFQDKFEKQGTFRGRDVNGKPTQLPRKAARNHYGDLSLEQLHKNTGLVFPFYQEDVGRSLSIIPKGADLNDGHRVQGQGLIENLVALHMSKKNVQDVLLTALDIPHNYSREFIDPLTDNKNEDRFKTIGYAMETLKKSEDLEKVMDLFKHLPEKERLLAIFQNAKV